MSAQFTPLIPPATPAPPPGSPALRTKLLPNNSTFKPVSLTLACPNHPPPPENSTPTPPEPPISGPTPPPTATAPTPAAIPETPPPPPANPPVTLPTPTVTYLQENGQITRIRVQCPCGSLLELECLY